MNATLPPLDPEDDKAAKDPGQPDWLGVAFVCLFVILFLPLWAIYLGWSWREGHYQYFPLHILMIAGLYWSRIDEARLLREDSNPRVVRRATYGLVFLAVVSHLLFSSFLVSISNIVLVSLATYFFFGWEGLKYYLPVIGLFFFAIPLPVGLDYQIIFEMQFLASRMASLFLDGAGVMHLREGVVLITEKSQFMTEEACSGIRSLFSSLSVVAVYSVAGRHAWLRTIVNLVQTVIWVLIANAVRVALTVVLADHVDVWFASGTGHELFSLFMFGMILAMVASTDQWTNRLLPLFFPSLSGDMDIEPDMLGSRSISDSPTQRFRFAFPGKRGVIATCVLLIAVVVGIRTTYIHQSETAGLVASIPRMPACHENDLPPNIGTWKRTSYEHVKREPSAIFSPESFRWVYQDGSVQAIVSVDCPWTNWHNLNVCYTAIGWRSKPQYFLPTPETGAFPGLTYSDLELDQKQGAHGRVYFSAVDRQRRDIGPNMQAKVDDLKSLVLSVISRMASSLGVGIEKRSELAGITLPVTTIQVLSEQPEKYTDEEIAYLRSFFFRVREQLLKSPRWTET